MGGMKALGPDDFPGIFYQTHWDILVVDVNEIIWEMMNSSKNPRRINATHLVLILKVQNSDAVSQFRPISLCNYSYKVLSKVLANRLKLFGPSRGLKQGYPLSPFLSLLVSEVLSLLIQQSSDRGWIRGVQMSKPGSTISHIFFAYDTLIFLRADEENCRHLSKVIDDYCFASGHKVNKSKSSVFFGSNVPETYPISWRILSVWRGLEIQVLT